MLLEEVPKALLFKLAFVSVFGIIKILDVDCCYIDIVDELVRVGGYHAYPREVRLALKHVLSGAHLFSVVGHISVGIPHLNLEDVLHISESDATSNAFIDLNLARDSRKQKIFEWRHLHQALVVQGDHILFGR
jgi:hypothetical protein